MIKKDGHGFVKRENVYDFYGRMGLLAENLKTGLCQRIPEPKP
jgi:hypothetical protein